ncbi:helix-turn-helix domain-containing protein [Nucisporomicrobium flavum]|jgi:hypothetical protein|uniref:helix-turn-helix domain-containing protein n=1 Tax=Nucisporomicrobium flavum TaxID=2785915 RepID=UPI003C2E37EC
MPRPERPIDPAAGPLAEFAAALRELRLQAGRPPYRSMAVRAHVSKASLSAAAAGHRLPTWDVTKAYVVACGGDPDGWRDRWLRVRDELGCAASMQEPGEPAPAGRRESSAVAGWWQRAEWSRVSSAAPWLITRRRPALLAAASCAAVIIAAPIAMAALRPDRPRAQATVLSPISSATPPIRFIGGPEPLGDNADPKKTGCGVDPATVTTLDTVEINTVDEHLLGNAQLRHSLECHASWGRFEPSGRLAYLPGPFTVTITAYRPATGTVGTPYTTDFDGQPVFGNILLDGPGCVEITVEIHSPHGDGTATTACRR